MDRLDPGSDGRDDASVLSSQGISLVRNVVGKPVKSHKTVVVSVTAAATRTPLHFPPHSEHSSLN